jgi:cytoskeletal protein RodZ
MVPSAIEEGVSMATFGEELRRERELRQISLREVSEATKINMRFLEALERNEFRHLPGGQFTKGFVRAFSQHIGLDAEAMVNAYLYELDRQQRDSESRGSALGVPKLAGEKPRESARRRGTLLVGTLLALAAVVTVLLFLWPGWLRPGEGGLPREVAPTEAEAP